MKTLLAVLILSLAAWGQTTTVTGTIVDPNGNPYSSGSITANINNPSSQAMLWNNSPLQATTWSGDANSAGTFTLQLPDLKFIGPATGVYYTFSVCANNTGQGLPTPSGQPSVPCFTYTSPACPTSGCITGATIDLSTALTALALPIQNAGGSGNVLRCGTAHAFTVYTDTAGITVRCDPFITSDLSGNETANSITLVNNVSTPQVNTTGAGFLLGPMKDQTVPSNPPSGFMSCWPDTTSLTFKCINADGSNALPTGGGSTFQPQVNGTNTGSTTVLNLLNPATFNGLTATWSNPGGGANVTFAFSGTLNNTGLTNSSTTVNGQTCTLGATCTVSGSAPVVVAGVSDTLTAAGTFSTQTSITAGSSPLLEIRAHGVYTTTATASPPLNIQINTGGTTGVCTHSANNVLGLNLTNVPWDAVCYIQIITTGNPGTAISWGLDEAGGTAGGSSLVSKNYSGNTSVSYITTLAQTVSVQETATLVSGESITLQSLIVRQY